MNVASVPAQTGFAEAFIASLTGKFGLTVMQIVLEVAGFPEAQTRFEARTHIIQSPFSGVYVNIGLFAPTMIPFTFHWYTGVVPPFVGVAVNVTDVPLQMGLAVAFIETLTGEFVFSTIVIVFDVAGLPIGQAILEFITQETISPLFGEYVYTGLLGPTPVPFTFHRYEGAAPPFVGVAVNVTEAPWQNGFADAEIETLTGIF